MGELLKVIGLEATKKNLLPKLILPRTNSGPPHVVINAYNRACRISNDKQMFFPKCNVFIQTYLLAEKIYFSFDIKNLVLNVI